MLKTIRVLLTATFIILGIASCSSPLVRTTPVPSPTNIPMPPAITPSQPQATVTKIQFQTESNYCTSSAALLPPSDAQGLSKDGIVRELMDRFLVDFNVPQAPDPCRTEGYRIDEINCDEELSDLTLEPKGDFVCKVLFSYKPVYQPSAALWGDMDQQGWFHTHEFVAVFFSDSGYTMKFARP